MRKQLEAAEIREAPVELSAHTLTDGDAGYSFINVVCQILLWKLLGMLSR